jgi:2-polyprenyl-6-hydroxyphenyl methylase / 3-demethylubiquinone-9 3-methyltransferase
MTQPADNSTGSLNLDPSEAEKFNAQAARWWDTQGDFKPLHDINGPRVEYIVERVTLQDSQVVDVGCGGGILSESLAARGAQVTGIDAAEKALTVARLHAANSGLEIDYRQITAEELAAEKPESFDLVCCLELLEHVPDPASTVAACAELCRPGGDVVLSTINRSPQSWAMAIAGAEYVLGLLPRGTHRYDRLIRPAELAAACRAAGLKVIDISGISYNPFSRTVRVGGKPAVNYLLHATRT